MPVNIATLIEDQEFKSLPASDKRKLLSEVDPEFGKLSDSEIQQFAPPQARVPDARTPQQGVLKGDSPYKDLGEAVPLWTSPKEFIAGMRSGRQLAGEGVGGTVLGGGLGLGRALATLLNPVGKTLNIIPQYTQAAGSVAGGDLNAALRDLTGSNPIQSAAEVPNLDTGISLLDIPVNTLGGTFNEVIPKQPISPLGLTPKALSTTGSALRSAGELVASPRTAFAKTIGREPVPILSKVLDYTESQTDKINTVINKVPELLPEIKSNIDASIKNGGERAINAIENSLEKRYDTYYPEIANAPEPIITKNLGKTFVTETLDSIKKSLDEAGVSRNDQKAIIDDLTPEIQSLNSGNIVNSTKLLNRQVAPLYKPIPTPSSLSNSQMVARSALRDAQSNAIHNILKDLGFDSKVYGEVGVLNEVKNQLSKKYIAAKNDLNKTLGESMNQAMRRGLKQGVGAGAVELAERAAARASRGKIGEIDRAMNLLFNQIESVAPQFRTGQPNLPTLPISLEEAILNSQTGENFLP